MPLPRSMPEILAAFGDNLKNDIRVCLPATVTAVHPERQTVDVVVAVNNPLNDDLGRILTEPAPSLSDVPMGIIRGGGFFVWIPVAIGDSVLLICSDLSTDTWRSGEGQPQDPGFVGKHTLDSPFAIPMIAPDAKFFADPAAAPTKLIIGKDGSPAQIRLSATDIELGNAATSHVALAELVATELGKIQTTLATGSNSGGAVVFATPYVPSSVASALIKGQ